jgi:putative hemolysin
VTGGIITDIVLIGVLLLINAFLAAAEIALVSARRPRLRQLAEEGNRAAQTALNLAETPAFFLATIQIGITVAGFFTSAVGAVSLVAALAALFGGLPAMGGVAETVSLVIVTTLLSFISIVLGELVPKTIAFQAADRIVLLVAPPIAFLARLTAPIVGLLTFLTNLILRLLGSERKAQFPSVSQDELLAMVETGKDEGVISPAQASMTEGVFGLSDRRARELMVPRVDVAALPSTATIAEARRLFVERGHSRIPIYEGDIDHIVGVLHTKDLLRLTGPDVDQQPVKALAREPLYVPEGHLASTLLRQLQRERRHLAIVIDEHGGTAGLITLEDLLEEIVGEITDEYDPDANDPLETVSEDEIVVSGGLPISDLNEALDLNLEEAGVDTVGGLITARLERFARVGETVDLGDATAEVLAMDRNRIRRVRVVRAAPRSRRQTEEEGE